MRATGKDHARVNLALWGDDDFLDLRVDEQLLYLSLWTSPGLSYCGAGDWHPGRIANLAADWTRDRVEHAAAGLSRNLFLIIDTDTDEYLLRSWIKHDGLWKTPNMAVSLANARAELSSRMLRGVIVHEVRRVRDAHPESTSWQREAVMSMLDQRAVDPAELEPFNPPSNPVANPSPNPWGQPIGSTPDATVNPNPTANPGPTPAPSPATTSISPTPREIVYEEPHLAHAERAPARRESRAETRLRELNRTARSADADAVARQFNQWAGGGVASQTLVEVAIEVDRLITDGIHPIQIAQGIKAWHHSDRLYPSQIPHFVSKAARPAEREAQPTKATQKAMDTHACAEQIIAEMQKETA
ncbi:hypothetical protein ACK8HH_17275 [Gordonia sp. LUNF6]|uniref:hypothetical protein n=1 Tax=unclassified Gordonia (in: high G+C Gram-positive bacteria) TaxID=2657482 RepID=UPI000782DB15|nr:hypothetical protein [Gordonia sp. QH-12]